MLYEHFASNFLITLMGKHSRAKLDFAIRELINNT